MFNEANVDKRRRERVRGLVLVATNSRHVEYLEETLKRSMPLFSLPEIPPGKLLTFCVSFDGYLTFDEGSFVKIHESPNPFVEVQYDPSAFAVVEPADPSMVITVFSNYAAGNQSATSVRITRSLPDESSVVVDYYPITFPGSDSEFRLQVAKTFVPGSVWEGIDGYPGFTTTLAID